MPEFNASAPAVPTIPKQREIRVYGWLLGLQIDPRGAPKAVAFFEQPVPGGAQMVAYLVPDTDLFIQLQAHLTNAALERLDFDRPHAGLLMIWHDGNQWRTEERYS